MPRNRPDLDEPACVVCGCTQNNACDGGCSWVSEDVCSACWPSWEEAVHVIRRLRRIQVPDKRRIEVARACRRIRDKAYEELGVP